MQYELLESNHLVAYKIYSTINKESKELGKIFIEMKKFHQNKKKHKLSARTVSDAGCCSFLFPCPKEKSSTCTKGSCLSVRPYMQKYWLSYSQVCKYA